MSSKKKIAIFYLSEYPPKIGANGGDRRLRNIAIGISDHSDSVSIIVPSWRDTNVSNSDSIFYKVKYISSIFKDIKILQRIGFWFNSVNYLLKNKYSAVILYNPTVDCILIVPFLKRNRIKVALEICDLKKTESKGFRWVQCIIIENYLPKFMDLNIGISTYICKHFKKVAEKVPALIIPILSDTNQFKSSNISRINYRREYDICEEDLLVVYSGGSWKTEGIPTLISAVNYLLKKGYNIKLHIAASIVKNNDEFDDIESYVSEINFEQIKLLGWVDTDTLIKLYSAADVFVVPQKNIDFNKAALPTKLAEYSSMGKAIVLADIGDVSIYYKDRINSVLIREPTVENIAEALVMLINDCELRERISSEVIFLSINQFSPSSAGKKIVDRLLI